MDLLVLCEALAWFWLWEREALVLALSERLSELERDWLSRADTEALCLFETDADVDCDMDVSSLTFLASSV